MKVIEIKNVHKIYSETEIEVRAVDGITLDFHEAGICCHSRAFRIREDNSFKSSGEVSIFLPQGRY